MRRLYLRSCIFFFARNLNVIERMFEGREGVTNEYLLCGLKIFVTQLVPLYTLKNVVSVCAVNSDVSAARITRLLQQPYTNYVNFRFDTDRPFFRIYVQHSYLFVSFFQFVSGYYNCYCV